MIALATSAVDNLQKTEMTGLSAKRVLRVASKGIRAKRTHGVGELLQTASNRREEDFRPAFLMEALSESRVIRPELVY